MSVGIERLKIINDNKGQGSWRFEVGQNVHHLINQIYISNFNLVNNKCEYIEVTPAEKLARYDIEFGIDVILNLANGQTCTVQEKILTTRYHTVTVEYYQDHQNQVPGDWFKLKCDFYFVGYIGHRTSGRLLRYILLDWNRVKLSNIEWQVNQNHKDNARANFRYTSFENFPANCIIASQFNNYSLLQKRIRELKNQGLIGKDIIEYLGHEFEYPITLSEVYNA